MGTVKTSGYNSAILFSSGFFSAPLNQGSLIGKGNPEFRINVLLMEMENNRESKFAEFSAEEVSEDV